MEGMVLDLLLLSEIMPQLSITELAKWHNPTEKYDWERDKGVCMVYDIGS